MHCNWNCSCGCINSSCRHYSSNCSVPSGHSQLPVEATIQVSSDCQAAYHSDEQRRPKFTDTLQEIAQERGVVADKTTTLVTVDRMSCERPSTVEEAGTPSRKRRRPRPPNIDLSKGAILQPSREASAPRQQCTIPGPTHVTVVNSLPLDPSRYAFMPISLSLSPLQRNSGRHGSRGSPINELLRMTSRLPDLSGAVPRGVHSQSSAMCPATVQGGARSVALVQRSPYTAGTTTIVNAENARDAEGRDACLVIVFVLLTADRDRR